MTKIQPRPWTKDVVNSAQEGDSGVLSDLPSHSVLNFYKLQTTIQIATFKCGTKGNVQLSFMQFPVKILNNTEKKANILSIIP